MALDTLLPIAVLAVTLAGAETLHGIARQRLLAPRIGKPLAVKVSAVTGTLLAFAVCRVLVPPIGLTTSVAHVGLGVGLALFMAAYDIGVGRWLLRKSWARIRPDFDPRTGNYLLFALVALAGMPWLVGRLTAP